MDQPVIAVYDANILYLAPLLLDRYLGSGWRLVREPVRRPGLIGTGPVLSNCYQAIPGNESVGNAFAGYTCITVTCC